uniref:Uncharacterized protein n=1 Tax=Setaria italica TaxID=4555 RepID=K3Y4D7_SETIT
MCVLSCQAIVFRRSSIRYFSPDSCALARLFTRLAGLFCVLSSRSRPPANGSSKLSRRQGACP